MKHVKKSFSKLLALLMVFMMVFTTIPVSAFAAEEGTAKVICLICALYTQIPAKPI